MVGCSSRSGLPGIAGLERDVGRAAGVGESKIYAAKARSEFAGLQS
jgi:hypothetical protein